MKTLFQCRLHPDRSLWTDDVQHLRENYRITGATLWRREFETDEEAAVRRMNWLNNSVSPQGVAVFRADVDKSFAETIDRKCPPPATTEVQVDWDTLEPVPVIHTMAMENGLWIAGIRQSDFEDLSISQVNIMLTHGNAAIGPTRETALRNLAEMQAVKKGKQS